MTVSRAHLLQVRTPEGVAFNFRLASPVLRAGALMVDWAAISAVWSMFATLISLLKLIDSDVAGLVAAVAFFALSQGYRIVTEWQWRGQSLGKRLFRLRVVDARGLRLSFSQIVLRNLLRLVDCLPAFYLVGGVATLLNSRAQRLGDLAAGTLVVWEAREAAPDFALLRSDKYNSLRSHAPAVARLRQAVSAAEARAAWAAVARRDEFEPEARVRLFGELAAHFVAVGGIPPELAEGVSDEQMVRNVIDVLYFSGAAQAAREGTAMGPRHTTANRDS